MKISLNFAKFRPTVPMPDLVRKKIGKVSPNLENQKGGNMKIEALCAAPPEALTHSLSQMPLSCPVAPQAKRTDLTPPKWAFCNMYNNF